MTLLSHPANLITSGLHMCAPFDTAPFVHQRKLVIFAQPQPASRDSRKAETTGTERPQFAKPRGPGSILQSLGRRTSFYAPLLKAGGWTPHQTRRAHRSPCQGIASLPHRVLALIAAKSQALVACSWTKRKFSHGPLLSKRSPAHQKLELPSPDADQFRLARQRLAHRKSGSSSRPRKFAAPN
jgi:hypothetical protein